MQAEKQLADLKTKFNTVWSTFEKVAQVIRTRADVTWNHLFPLVSDRFCSFVRLVAGGSLTNTLAHIKVINPDFPLEKLVGPAESQDFLDRVKAEEAKVKDAALQLADRIVIDFPQ